MEEADWPTTRAMGQRRVHTAINMLSEQLKLHLAAAQHQGRIKEYEVQIVFGGVRCGRVASLEFKAPVGPGNKWKQQRKTAVENSSGPTPIARTAGIGTKEFQGTVNNGTKTFIGNPG